MLALVPLLALAAYHNQARHIGCVASSEVISSHARIISQNFIKLSNLWSASQKQTRCFSRKASFL